MTVLRLLKPFNDQECAEIDIVSDPSARSVFEKHALCGARMQRFDLSNATLNHGKAMYADWRGSQYLSAN
jgi:hypothetical protein